MTTKAMTKHNRTGLLARVLGLAALVGVMLLGSVESSARLDPYFFLRGRGFGKITPRILFVLDTSGSMTFTTLDTDYQNCTWDQCESTTDGAQSRIAGARQAINAVVNTASDQADFALMTFDHVAPPVSAGEVPSACANDTAPDGSSIPVRFAYVDEVYHDPGPGGNVDVNTTNPWGGVGAWMLCGTNRPYPYLRWDELGFTNGPGSQNNFFAGQALPAGPLALQYSDEDTYVGDTNSDGNHGDGDSPMFRRRVQFFGEFVGSHVRLDCSDSGALARAQNSQGDYALTEICNHDFYYWPYVDGFVGYSHDGGDPPVGDGWWKTCPAANQTWTCSGGTQFDSCSSMGPAGAECFDPDPSGPAVFDTCNSTTPGGQICREDTYNWCTNPYNPWGPDPSFDFNCWVEYWECNSLPTKQDQEQCCEWFSNVKFGDPNICKATKNGFSGAGCGNDETCCENLGTTVFGDPEACKIYTCDDWQLSCSAWSTTNFYDYELGVHERGGPGDATLLAPFYFEAAITQWQNSGNPADQVKTGPLDRDWANNLVGSLTSHQMYGGVDADSGTPWTGAVGDVSDTAAPDSNAPFAHTSVASYLKYIEEHPGASRDACVPTYAVLISDGFPSNCTTCTTLKGDLAEIRNDLGVNTYVVGFGLSGGVINEMACAAAGDPAGCGSSPANQWDTCADPTDPGNKCAFAAKNPQQLADALLTIVTGALDIQVPSGPGSSLNFFKPDPSSPDDLQLQVNATTDYPSWAGHVRREPCDTLDTFDADGDQITNELAPWCVPPATALPADAGTLTFGPCLPSWTWDAGQCLKDTKAGDRRVYSFDANKNLYQIANTNNDPPTATGKFVSEFQRVTGRTLDTQNNEDDLLVQFILGYGWPGDPDPNYGWKLPGLASSAPITVRRIPKPNPGLLPSVGIRDPHCAGRILKNPVDIPKSLQQFAASAQTPVGAIGSGGYHEYQEAIIIGDDLGMIHAFQTMSGNELFALAPPFVWDSVWDQYVIGAGTRGQPPELENHNYGVSATANHGWVFDDGGTQNNTADDQWRHLLVMGLGIGGTEFIAMDVSHMGRFQSGGDPVDILWTTEDSNLKNKYETWMGETWSRPALTYRFEGTDYPPTDLSKPPKAYLVMGSGYEPPLGSPNPADPRGRRVWLSDAITGEVVEFAKIPGINASQAFDASVFGMVVDPAVGTHCDSRYWGEMEEVYFADPYGRVFRWDQGFPVGHADEHINDGDTGRRGRWQDNNDVARPAVRRLMACRGADPYQCTVNLNGEKIGDPFFYSPAVLALDRIDDPNNGEQDKTAEQKNQLLIALGSGALNDDATDVDTDFHPSIYLMVDDHRPSLGEPNLGFNVPGTGGRLQDPGTHASYMRMTISGIKRIRCIDFPYDGLGNPVCDDTNGDGTGSATATFSKKARVIRAPRINVAAVRDFQGDPNNTAPVFNHDIEVVTVTYTVYEPGDQGCDKRWLDDKGTVDKSDDEWLFDTGSTYQVSFRLTVSDTIGFDFVNGSGRNDLFDALPFGGGAGGGGGAGSGVGGPGLIGPVVVDYGAPPTGGASGVKMTPGQANMPCDPNEDGGGVGGQLTVPIAWSEVSGFNPVE